jgi:hypothetical protein
MEETEVILNEMTRVYVYLADTTSLISDEIALQYSFTPPLEGDTGDVYFSSRDSSITILPHVLDSETSYNLTITVRNNTMVDENNECEFCEVAKSIEFLTTFPPKEGSMEVSPIEGFATKNTFTFQFADWKSKHYPLKVQLHAGKNGEQGELLGELVLESAESRTVYETTLPMLDKVIAKISDSVG